MTLDVAQTLLSFRAVLAAGVGTAEGERAEESLRLRLSSSQLSSWAPLDRQARQIDVDADVLRFGPPLSHHASLVLSMTRSGWTRLRAVERLAGNAALTLAALMWRLDDVIGSVRDAAQARLTEAIVTAPSVTLARLMPVADVLGPRDRIQGNGFLAELFDRVRAAHIVDAADQPLEVQRSLRRFWGLDHESNDAQRTAIALQALDDGDVALALAVAHRASVAMRPTLAAAFARHPVGAVRVRAAELARPSGARTHDDVRDEAPRVTCGEEPLECRLTSNVLSAASGELLLGLSVDTRADVRAAARRVLGNTTDEQREVARSVVDTALVDDLGNSVALIGALASLAEIGRVDDFGRISRFLHDGRVRVQAEAVRALVGSHASGGLEVYVDVLLDKMQSPAWRVGVEAARAFSWFPAQLLPAHTLRELEPHLHPAVRKLLQPLVGPGRWSC